MEYPFQSPRGDFGFLKTAPRGCRGAAASKKFQSPRGDFGFLKSPVSFRRDHWRCRFQSPRGDFGFLKTL